VGGGLEPTVARRPPEFLEPARAASPIRRATLFFSLIRPPKLTDDDIEAAKAMLAREPGALARTSRKSSTEEDQGAAG
jgi:hypothetical protein